LPGGAAETKAESKVVMMPLRKVELSKPPDTMEPVDVAWANMKVADQTHNLEWFIGGAMGWLRANRDRKVNYQLLETELRKRDFETHLIARKPTLTGCSLHIPYGLSPELMDYECIMSCRPRQYAISEMLESAASYEENWARLAFAGTVMQDPDEQEMVKEAVSAGSVRLLREKEKSLMERFSNNEVLVQVHEVSFNDHMTQLEAQFPGLRMVVYAMASNGSPILVCVAGEPRAIISEIAFMVTAGPNGTKMIRPIHLDSLVEQEEAPAAAEKIDNNNNDK